MILTYIGLGLGLTSIIVTIIVAKIVYKLQRDQNISSSNILKEIAKVTINQAEILESIDKQRKMHIHWFIRHVGGNLKTLIKQYRELDKRLETYHNTRFDQDLNKASGGIHICRNVLNQLIPLAERDFPIVSAYLTNPWIAGKFLDAISILDIPISDDREEIRNLNDDEIISLRDLIDLRIQDMEGYLDIIKQEEIIQN